MIKKILTIFIWMFLPLVIVAAPVEDYNYLSWDAVTTLVGDVQITSHDQVQGYKLYCSPTILSPAELRVFTNQVNVANVAGISRIKSELASLPLNEGDNWCALTAWNYNDSGEEQEGGLSNWLNVKMTAGRFQNVSVPAVVSGFKLER